MKSMGLALAKVLGRGCEHDALALGVRLEKRDKTYDHALHLATAKNPRGPRLWFYRFRLGRDVLNVKWHTKAGAWQAALRWAKAMKKGTLR